MKASQLLAGLYVLASILIDLVVAVQLDSDTPFSEVLWIGLSFGQLALLALWCLRGPGPRPVRWLAALAGAGGIALVWSSVHGHPANQWLAALCLFMTIVAGSTTLLLGRMRWVMSRPDRHPPRVIGRKPLQWSVGGLLALMTSIAIGLSLWREVSFPWPYLANLVICFTALAGVAIASFSVISSAGRAPGRVASLRAVGTQIIVLSSVCLVSGLLLAVADDSFSVWQFTQASFVEAIVICFGGSLCQADQPAVAESKRRTASEIVAGKSLHVFAEE